MKCIFGLSAASLGFLLTLGFHAYGKEFISEASGVCRLGKVLVIAGDENPNSLWIIEDQSKIVKRVAVPNREWDDMEDLTAVDDERFFAVTSHSRPKNGKLKAEREQLLLIAHHNSTFTVTHAWTLREKILSALESSVGDGLDLKALKTGSPDEGGLNVEGLAFHNEQLYLGLRSPLTNRGDALVLRIKNGKGLLSGEFPVFAEVLVLPLQGKGIRGLTSHGTDLLVLAGSPNDKEEAFSLHHWTPGSNQVAAFSLPGFAKLIRPEAVLAEKDHSFTFVQDFEKAAEQAVVVNLRP